MPAPSSKLVLTGAAFAALALGCNFAPVYVKPGAPTPAAFKELPPAAEGWKPAEPGDRLLRGSWWEAFRDPQLNSLEAQVANANQNVALALARFQAARALVRQAQSQYYPTLTVSPAVTRSRQLYTPSPGSPATPYTVTEFSLPFDATWEADFWGRIRNTVKAGTLEAQASLADLGNVRLAQQAELAVAYFQIQAQDAQAELLTSAVADYQEALTLVRIQEGAGMASGQDVEQALTLLTATRAQATDLSILRAQLEHAIATLTGRTASAFSLPAHALNAQPLLIPPGLPAELLERRPDIAAAERRVAAANAQIGVARAAYFPTAFLGASAGYQHAALGGLVSSPNLLWSVGATLAGTLFDGGRRRAVTEQAKATYLGTVATYRQTVLGAFQDVEDNLSTLRLLAVERGQQDEAVASAQRYLALALSRYDAGLDLYLEVITARTALLSNQRVAAGLRMQQMVASVQLIKALGGGWRAEPAGS